MNTKLTLHNKNAFYSFGLFLFFLWLCATTVAQELPVPHKYVEDKANIMSDPAERKLNGYLQELEQKTGAQMIVLTINTTGDIPIDTYAVELATRWKLGQKGKDNGVLVVIAKNDRAYRVEVGYGLEGILPDSYCGTIGRTYFVPYFQKGKFDEGIFYGVSVMVYKIAEVNGVKITGMPNIYELNKKASRKTNPFLSLLLMLVIVPFIIFSLFNRRRSPGYWWGGGPTIFGGPRGSGFGGSGGFGGFGSFGGGGGGSFGGGGASGRW